MYFCIARVLNLELISPSVKKVYGVLCSKSNCQRAHLQMLARCRNVEDGCIDIANSPQLQINENHNFWTYREVYANNKETVSPGTKFVMDGSQLILSESIDTRRKKRTYRFSTRWNA